MNVDAKAFVPSFSSTTIPSDVINTKEHCQRQKRNGAGAGADADEHKETKKQDQRQRQRQRRRRHARRDRNVDIDVDVGGLSKQNKLSIPEDSQSRSSKPEAEGDADHGINHGEDEIQIPAAKPNDNAQQQQHQGKLTKHQQQNQQKQRRRRRNAKKGNTNTNTIKEGDPEVSNRHSQSESEFARASSSSKKGNSCNDSNGQHHHHSQKSTNHRKHNRKSKSKKRSDQRADIHNNRLNTINTIEEIADVSFHETSFPTLATPPITLVTNNVGSNTSWKESLASKITSSLDSEEKQKQQIVKEKMDRAQSLASTSVAQLTMLSSRSSSSAIDEKEVVMKETSSDVPHDEDAIPVHPPPTATADSSSAPQSSSENNDQQHSTSTTTTTITLNTKSKWSGSELSKMRQRWWEAVRAKRKKCEEDRKLQRQLEKRDPTIANGVEGEYGHEEGIGFHDEDADSSSADESSSLSYSDEENSIIENAPYVDTMQPPSLSTPFDEMSTPLNHPLQPESPRVAQSILDLEQVCIQSLHPLHCAIYNHALISHKDESLQNNHDNKQHDIHINSATERSDAEVVLHRLVMMQDPNDAMRWKNERVGLTDMRGLESNNAQHQESRVKALTANMAVGLLSADTTSLTPLQLAIYWNLPSIVRILCTTAAPSMSNNYKKTEDEDEHGRTPLMLACELSHEACIQTIICASSPKLDRRERVGGNTAFHFCCINPQGNVNREDDILECNVSGCVEAIDMLLRYTPIALQKRALMLTNCRGQNLLHLACSRGDVRLVERLLEHPDAPGMKISKALDAKDRVGYTPFLTAVAADATDIVMHLLTTRFAGSRPAFSSWFAGCPLIVAASKNSVDMTKLLLEIVYDASTVWKLPGIGEMAHNEASRALLETIYRMTKEEEKKHDNTYEIIRLLISQGGANPHLPVSVRFPGKPKTQGDRTVLLCHLKGKMAQEDVPLSAAVRSSDAEAVRCMIDAYASALRQLKSVRRKDPLLRSQPESYFQKLEEREDDTVNSSVDAALVASLFLLWQESDRFSYGRCALVLYKRGRINLSSTSIPRKLSQRAIQWLEHCLLMRLLVAPPSLTNNSMEGYYFEAPLVQYRITPNLIDKKIADKIPYHDAGANFMDWSYVLAHLPWFRSQINGVNCNLMQSMISNLDETEHVNFRKACERSLSEDEFFLVANGEKLLAHKSIVSARSGKLAAHIRFTEAHEQQDDQKMSVYIDLSPWVTKMLLCHCYHGSIVFGLLKTPLKQCRQLLEMALVAEEYLCHSLVLECEIRLLMQTSSEVKCVSLCLCPRCSGATISTKVQVDCPTQRLCLENAERDIRQCNLSMYCEPVGVYAYKTSTFIMMSSRGGLITPESALDVLAVAQQLEQSSSCQQGSHTIKYCRSGSIDHPNSTMAMPSCGGWNIDAVKDVGAGLISVPFATAKMMAVWIMLRDFPAVIRSDSYLRQINGGSNEDDIDEADAPFAIGARSSNDEDAILLLRTCLEELVCSPFNKNRDRKCYAGI